MEAEADDQTVLGANLSAARRGAEAPAGQEAQRPFQAAAASAAGIKQPRGHQTAPAPPARPHRLPPFINQDLGVNRDSEDDGNTGNLLQIWTCTRTRGTATTGRGVFSPALNATQRFLSPKEQKLVLIFQLLRQTSFHG